MNTNSTHIINILQKLLKGEALISSDYSASNSNQYFRAIKMKGIELIEVWEPNKNNSGKHKKRRLNQSINNIKKANNCLIELKGEN